MVNVTEDQPTRPTDAPGTPLMRVPVRRSPARDPQPPSEPVIRAEHLTIRYGSFTAVRDASPDVPAHRVTAIIGPSGCGNSPPPPPINPTK